MQRRTNLKIGLIFISALSVAACATNEREKTMSTVNEGGPIEDFREPREGLYTGGQPTEANFAQALDAGVKTVITLRTPEEPGQEEEAALTEAYGMELIRLPIAGKADITLQNAQALRALLESQEKPVLLHCGSGNRVGALLTVAAVKLDGMDQKEALALGEAAGLSSLRKHVIEVLNP